MALWGGRFQASHDAEMKQLMDELNQSISVDKRLYNEDITGSQAYARALVHAGLLTTQEGDKLVAGLEQVRAEWRDGLFEIKTSDEDIHTANERRLSELIGPLAGKLHTGRSRNDQVQTDVRLWLREECKRQIHGLIDLIKALVDRAETEMDVVMPGFTHLQRAQPIRWSHFLLSYASSLQGDVLRLKALLLDGDSPSRINSCPLGSGALAGNPFAIDRRALATELGFHTHTMNSLQAVADRDGVLDFMYWATMLMLHLSRLSEDLIVYSSAEFGTVQLSETYSTGSSLMPQKKNPDSLELIRGKCGRVFGCLSGFLMTCKALPSTYNKDMQEDKEHMFDTADTVTICVKIMKGVISSLTINPERMKGCLSEDMLATDVAEYLVRKGVPFRQAHHHAGELVALAEKKTRESGLLVSMSQLSLAEFKAVKDKFEADITDKQWWSFERSAESRNVIGGTSKSSIKKQIKLMREFMANQ